MSTLKLHLLRSLLVLGAMLLGLTLVEVGGRACAPRPVFELRGLHEFRPDRPWIYGLRAGAQGTLSDSGAVVYRINADGFRDQRVERPKPPGVFRLLVLGDSISFGYGVEEDEAFPQQLELRLAEVAPEARVEVVNLGVGGYNAYNEARLLEGLGASYQPDVVLVQFCINDLNDPTLHFDHQTRLHLGAIPDAAYPDPSKRRVAARDPSRWLRLCRRVRFCAALDDLLLHLYGQEAPDDVAARRAAGVPVGADAPEWNWLEARYQEMAHAAGQMGARFAVLGFPFLGQIAGSGPDPLQERLRALAQANGWPFLDPLPGLRRAQRVSREKLFLDPWHPTLRGHREAAEAALVALACSGLLPAQAHAFCLPAADAGARLH